MNIQLAAQEIADAINELGEDIVISFGQEGIAIYVQSIVNQLRNAMKNEMLFLFGQTIIGNGWQK